MKSPDFPKSGNHEKVASSQQHTDLDLIVLELLFSPDAVVPHSTGDLAANSSSGGLGKSFNVPAVF